MKNVIFLLLAFMIFSCKKKQSTKVINYNNDHEMIDTIGIENESVKKIKDTLSTIEKIFYSNEELAILKDSSFVNLKKLDTTFLYAMAYATKDNFLNEKVYDCDNCLLRYKTAKQLIKINNELKKEGLKILFFDCYRPLDVQKKMWQIFPDKRYVANPIKGSNHNRGTAVDITLAKTNGETLVMGTKFDYFGKKAHHAYTKFPEQVIENRKKLKAIMEKNGFWSITSEWWHYNLNQSYKYSVSNFKTECID